uniref:Uncharacterized protein n=1 Tax=Cucumis melo TaxID=3656 RepID=A0A9I9EM93_CUCME
MSSMFYSSQCVENGKASFGVVEAVNLITSLKLFGLLLVVGYPEDFEKFWSKCSWDDDLKYAKAVCDHVKDQTYFLSHLSQNQLKRLLFPLGCIPKLRYLLCFRLQGVFREVQVQLLIVTLAIFFFSQLYIPSTIGFKPTLKAKFLVVLIDLSV